MSGITADEWMAEIDRLRPERHHRAAEFRPEHDAAILAARDKKPPLSWAELSLLAKGWGWPASAPGTLLKRYRELKAAGK